MGSPGLSKSIRTIRESEVKERIRRKVKERIRREEGEKFKNKENKRKEQKRIRMKKSWRKRICYPIVRFSLDMHSNSVEFFIAYCVPLLWFELREAESVFSANGNHFLRDLYIFSFSPLKCSLPCAPWRDGLHWRCSSIRRRPIWKFLWRSRWILRQQLVLQRLPILSLQILLRAESIS